jgi:outer membrane protein assembly factor BamE (lipoprotein component of BamABCDE complex)
MLLRPVFAAAALVLALGACAPITSHHGFQAVEANPKDVLVGVDTKSTVMEKLGSPSTVSTFDPNTWYYVSQITDRVSFYRPQVRSRDIVAIGFDKATEQVAAVNTYTLKDGKVIAFNGRETPTRGRELSILEQLLGNVGRGSLAPTEDVTPGSRSGR